MHIPTLFSQIKVTIDLCSIVKNILPAPFKEHLQGPLYVFGQVSGL